jgi:hypothetical protein
MASEVGGLLIKLSADVGGLTSGEKQATASLDRIDGGAKKAQASLGGLTGAFSSAGGTAESLAERLEATRRATAGIASGAERSASDIYKLRSDFVDLSDAMDSASVDRVSAQLKELGRTAGAQGTTSAAKGIREVAAASGDAEKEARKLREEFKRAVAGEAVVAVSGRVANALQQLGGAAGAVGQGIGGLGQILQGAFQGGLLGGAVATLGVAIQGIGAYMLHARQEAEAFRASMQQAFETAAQGANTAFDGMRAVTAQLRAMQAARASGISVEQAANEGEQAALEAKIKALEQTRKAQAQVAIASLSDVHASNDVYFGHMAEAGATGKDIEAAQLQLQASQMRAEMQAQQRADAQQLQQLGSGLSSASKMGAGGEFGAALAKIGRLWTQMGDRTDEAAMAFRGSLLDAREAVQEQADAARRSAAAVTRNVEGQRRMDAALAAIGRSNRGQLGIDEGTSSPHGRFLLGQADAARAAKDSKEGADAWVELQGRVKEIAADATEELNYAAAQASMKKLHQAVDDFSDGFGGSLRQAYAAVKNRLGDNLTSGVNDSMDLGNAFAAVGQNMAQAAGGAMANMVQGFSQGGIAGGIIGALASSKQMNRVMGILGDVFQSAADAIGSILEPLMPFLTIVGMVLKAIFGIIKPLAALLMLEPLLKLLFDGLKILLGVVAAIAAGITWIVVSIKNAFYSGIADLLEWISASFFKDEIASLRASVEQQKTFSDTIKDAYNEVNDVDYKTAKLGDAADDAAEALYNLAGFKMEKARFDALGADSRDIAPGSTNIYGDVHVSSGDIEQGFANYMRNAAMARGTPVMGENPFATLPFSTG